MIWLLFLILVIVGSFLIFKKLKEPKPLMFYELSELKDGDRIMVTFGRDQELAVVVKNKPTKKIIYIQHAFSKLEKLEYNHYRFSNNTEQE